ncbi:MAG: alkaline phosphatase family protein [Bacteroidota bacterium]|nr:alkaline phosphatase family protein [Bacteroidota bacterium]
MKIDNLNTNVLEYLNSFDEFKNEVVAFTSWDVFPSILSERRSGFPVYSGYDSIEENGDLDLHVFNKAQEKLINAKSHTMQDVLTFIAASEYIKANKPKVVFIGLGECDEDAHRGEYDSYLKYLNEGDKMIQQLWYYIQSTPEYKNKTTLIITTDHGRGKRKNKWTEHDVLVKGSADGWLAVMSPDTKPKGEMQLPQQLYQKQLASTISTFLEYNFTGNHPVAKAIDFNKVN